LWIDVVQFGGDDQRVHEGRSIAAAIRPTIKEIADRNDAENWPAPIEWSELSLNA